MGLGLVYGGCVGALNVGVRRIYLCHFLGLRSVFPPGLMIVGWMWLEGLVTGGGAIVGGDSPVRVEPC